MVLLIVISGLGSFIYAQNNPYKIKDSLYELYKLGYNNISNEKCLIYADSLYRQSARDNDKKAQCLGAVLRVRYATRRNNLADVQREAEFARKVARRNGFDRYYYYAYQVEIVWLLNHDSTCTCRSPKCLTTSHLQCPTPAAESLPTNRRKYLNDSTS